MNYLHFLTFLIFIFSVLISGTFIHEFLSRGRQEAFLNRSLYLGEALLLGSIFLIGQMMVLSLIGLYKAPFLWGTVLLDMFFIFQKDVRARLRILIATPIPLNFPVIVFLGLLLIFIFRNCYFMVDIDDQMTYLYTQKLWLEHGSSLVGDETYNHMIFFPQFDAAPYALGISLFGQETLFAELINLFWRLIAALLVFGYTAYRFNAWCGLAAGMFVILNDHIFYSGANQWVIINGAIVSLIFATAYNFWESRRTGSALRLILAMIFASQITANKYQMIYTFFYLMIFGLLIQPALKAKLKDAVHNKRFVIGVCIAICFTSLWPLKNFLMTGLPLFPVLAGHFHALGWIPEQDKVCVKVFGGVSLMKFVKYMTYFFIWPGITAAKYVILTIVSLPVILMSQIFRNKLEKENLTELLFWLALCILLILGTCVATFWDPRYYRYSIAVLAFAAVIAVRYILRDCGGLKNDLVIGLIAMALALPGYRIIVDQGGSFKRPTIAENIGVVSNRIHMDDVIKKYYPQVINILNELEANKEKFENAAWSFTENTDLPTFLLPRRPMISMWRTTLIRWDSYASQDTVLKDLDKHGIRWVMTAHAEHLKIMSAEEFAAEATKYDLHPKEIFYTYDFPRELVEIHY